ncbi:MAG TPA: SOS response-associated peptidase [Chryseolinea sp.]|nr:SOS response-associated peptidase [Chryseolinea sp.]
MIERYSITASAEKINKRFDTEVLDTYRPHFNAAPTHLLPVITTTSPQGLSIFYWGTSPEWSKNKSLGEKIINIRAEAIQEKPMLKKGMMKHRCLVPADGFYGWKKVGKKTSIPYRIITNDQELFSFAGIWEEFDDAEGNERHTFSIITTESNTIVAGIQERMPVILTKASEKVWLNKQSSETDLIGVLLPYASEKMNYYPVSPSINNSNTNVPSLIIPTPPADQFGNLTLFD